MKDSKQPSIYAYPRLSKTDLLFVRIGGNGLGNLLLTWARCLVQAQQHGWNLIWPTWNSFKPKNWRVNPYDHRTYADLFQPSERYISGWRKPLTLSVHPRLSEKVVHDSAPAPGSIVEFRGMEGMFTPILHFQPLVSRALVEITRRRHLGGYLATSAAPISIHVRRGDFIQRPDGSETTARHNSALPLQWYIDALQAVRARAGKPVPAVVFSDGEDEELAPLISMHCVSRVDYGSSLADMLALARSRLIIASGSTFSMWGTFLGQVPTLWHPGKLLQSLLVQSPELEFEWAAGDTMPDWIRNIEAVKEPTID